MANNINHANEEKKIPRACPFDTDGDGHCGQRNCPFCGEFRRPATSGSQDVRLRADDEYLMRQVQEWLEDTSQSAGQAAIVFPNHHHAMVVVRELGRRIGATNHRRSGRVSLLVPGGSEIHVLTEAICGHGHGQTFNRVFCHSGVGFEAYAAIKPCEKGDEWVIRDGIIYPRV